MIETKRLILRPFNVSDIDAYYDVLSQEAVHRWLGKGGQITKERVKRLIASYQNHWKVYQVGPWAMISKDTHALIGHCGFQMVDALKAFELMYALSEHEWKKGYASEAALASLAWLRDKTLINHVIALSYLDNVRSIHVIEKMGFLYKENVHLFGVDLKLFTKDINR